MSFLKKISSSAGLTRKAMAEVRAPTTSMHKRARRNFGVYGLAMFNIRLKVFIFFFYRKDNIS
jgi:hypothetical protein